MTETTMSGKSAFTDAAARPLARRDILKGMAGLAGLGVLGGIIDACGAVSATAVPSAPVYATASSAAASIAVSTPASPVASATSAAAGEVTMASYLPLTDLLAEFTRQRGISVKVNTVDANDFGDRLDAYLVSTPEDVFTFGPGYEMRSAAAKGLLAPLDDIWNAVGSTMPASLKLAATGQDDHQYAIPGVQYPWAVFYRKSVFAKHGYAVPTTWNEYKALARQMQADGLIPIAMGDKELYPALGTFDIINLRLNGYQFHIDLLAGKERWNDPRVARVFGSWKELLPFTQSGGSVRPWAEAADALSNREAGMYFFGLFLTNVTDDNVNDDLDMFPFPKMGTPFDAENAIDGPSDSFMIAIRSSTLARDLEDAKGLIGYLAKGPSQTRLALMPGFVAPSSEADITSYSPLQRRASELLRSAGRTAQFFDRDTDKAFGYAVGALLQEFLDEPDQDLDDFLGRIQEQWPNP
jgi:multiple sugar transport system substrate-binding protein